MKNIIYTVLVLVLSVSLFSCGASKTYKPTQKEEITFTLKEKKEIVKRQIVKKQRTIIATP